MKWTLADEGSEHFERVKNIAFGGLNLENALKQTFLDSELQIKISSMPPKENENTALR